MNQYPQQYQQQNPYAAPQAQVMPTGYGPSAAGGRMEGDTLVMPNGATFPAVCVKCGTTQPIEWRNQRFVFTPVWAWYFLGWIGYFIFTKRSSFSIPLCPPCHSTWKKSIIPILLSIAVLFGSIMLAGVVAGAMEDGGTIVGIMFMVGLVAFVALLIYGIVVRSKRTVVARKIDNTYSWLRGIHPTALQAIVGGGMPQAYPQQQLPQGYPQQQQAYPQQGYPQQGGGYGYPQQ
jgi:hypothetical protein